MLTIVSKTGELQLLASIGYRSRINDDRNSGVLTTRRLASLGPSRAAASKKEIISLHIGQTGVQIADPLWRLLSTEHNIAVDGTQLPCPTDTKPVSAMCPEILEGIDCKKSNGNFEQIFQETREGKFYGRSILIDPDPETIGRFQRVCDHGLYKRNNFITANDSCANLFAKGYISMATQMKPKIYESIRKMLEECDLPDGFLIFCSLGGGTGSGLTASLLNSLRIYYKKLAQIQLTVFPTPQSTTVEPYNCALHDYKLTDNSAIILIDNDALYNALRQTRQTNVGFEGVNSIIAQLASNLTISNRFDEISEGMLGLRELRFLLSPTRNIRYSSFAYSPIASKWASRFCNLNELELTTDCFTCTNQLINCPGIEKTPNLGTCMIYRGNNLNYFKARDSAGECLRPISSRIPIGVNVCVSQKNSYIVNEKNVTQATNTACRISTNMALKFLWERTYYNYKTLLKKRAFLHWFENEKMASCDFTEAQEKLCNLIDEYNFIFNGF